MARKTIWENRKVNARAAQNADQTEFSAIQYGSCNLEAGIMDERIAEAMDDYSLIDPQGVEDWADADAQYENATSEIATEVHRRSEVLGECYPFEIDGNRLIYKKSHTLAYEFCLAVTQAQSLTTGDFARLPRAFERLARDTVCCFLGKGAKSYRTGWPSDTFETRPTKFKSVIEELHRQTGQMDEWVWGPLPSLPEDPSHKDNKDLGLDFVAWKEVRDKRLGRLFLLGQCACGNDWEGKTKDICIQTLENWIRPLSAANPLRVFAVPVHIPNDAYFGEIHRKAGLTFDRARIAILAETPENREAIIAKMCDSYAELIALVIPGFEAVELS